MAVEKNQNPGSHFGATARPRDTRILVPEKNRAAQNRTS